MKSKQKPELNVKLKKKATGLIDKVAHKEFVIAEIEKKLKEAAMFMKTVVADLKRNDRIDALDALLIVASRINFCQQLISSTLPTAFKLIEGTRE